MKLQNWSSKNWKTKKNVLSYVTSSPSICAPTEFKFPIIHGLACLHCWCETGMHHDSSALFSGSKWSVVCCSSCFFLTDVQNRERFLFSGKFTQSATAIGFSFDKSLYADDKTKLAVSRGNLQKCLQLIFSVFKHLVSSVTLDEMAPNQRLRLCTFQHQVSNMKMRILVHF